MTLSPRDYVLRLGWGRGKGFRRPRYLDTAPFSRTAEARLTSGQTLLQEPAGGGGSTMGRENRYPRKFISVSWKLLALRPPSGGLTLAGGLVDWGGGGRQSDGGQAGGHPHLALRRLYPHPLVPSVARCQGWVCCPRSLAIESSPQPGRASWSIPWVRSTLTWWSFLSGVVFHARFVFASTSPSHLPSSLNDAVRQDSAEGLVFSNKNKTGGTVWMGCRAGRWGEVRMGSLAVRTHLVEGRTTGSSSGARLRCRGEAQRGISCLWRISDSLCSLRRQP